MPTVLERRISRIKREIEAIEKGQEFTTLADRERLTHLKSKLKILVGEPLVFATPFKQPVCDRPRETIEVALSRIRKVFGGRSDKG